MGAQAREVGGVLSLDTPGSSSPEPGCQGKMLLGAEVGYVSLLEPPLSPENLMGVHTP